MLPASCRLVAPADLLTLDIRLSAAPLLPRTAAPEAFIPDDAPTPALLSFDPFEDVERPGRGRGKFAVSSFGLEVEPFMSKVTLSRTFITSSLPISFFERRRTDLPLICLSAASFTTSISPFGRGSLLGVINKQESEACFSGVGEDQRALSWLPQDSANPKAENSLWPPVECLRLCALGANFTWDTCGWSSYRNSASVLYTSISVPSPPAPVMDASP